MKRQIAVLLASAMLWSCAGCSGAQDAGNTASTEKRTAKFSIDSVSDDLKNGEKTPAQTEKESRQVPASNTPVAEKETESPLPELTVTRHNLRLDHEDEVIFEGCYDDFALKEESAKAYPALAAAIEDTCSWIPGDVEASLAYTAQYMADYGYESTYEYDTELAITRADRNVVSFCISHESWFGGPHANHYFYPYVFDTKTGEEIPANAIVKDMDALIGAAAERLLNDKALDGLEQDELVDSLQEVLGDSDLPYGLSEDAFLVYLGDYWLGEYDLGW
ncbi:MAG TPA: hypothetical protein DGX96_11440, partial [Lachnospiraceae bacterium]|nr:hypothetical protein [Lachnospiraceae bacterium]